MANTVTAYQTLEDRDNIDYVESDGPFQCKRGDAWLGHGYYFWDSNLQWAIDWGENSFKTKGKEFIVASCGIDLSKQCLDLFGSVADKLEFLRIVEVMKQSGKIKEHHRLILPNIIQFMVSNNIFPYKSIRSADYPKMQLRLYFSSNPDRGEFTILNQRVQICVKQKKEVVLQPFKVIFPEKYLD